MRTILFLLSVSLLAVSCSRQESSTPAGEAGPVVLATVGDREITAPDLEAEAERRLAIGRPVPDAAALLQEMIAYESLLQRAHASGLSSDPEIQRELNNLLIGKLQERELIPKLESIEVSDEALRQEYENRIEEFTRPARIRLAMLHLETTPVMTDARRQEVLDRITEARERVLNNPPEGGRGPGTRGFGTLAIDYSDHQASRYRGGDLGWLDPKETGYPWPEDVLQTGFQLDRGEVSPIIESDGGLYLVMKTDSRESLVRSFDEVRSTLKQQWIDRRREELKTAFQERSQELAGVEWFTNAIPSVQLPVSQPKVARSNQNLPPASPGGR